MMNINQSENPQTVEEKLAQLEVNFPGIIEEIRTISQNPILKERFKTLLASDEKMLPSRLEIFFVNEATPGLISELKMSATLKIYCSQLSSYINTLNLVNEGRGTLLERAGLDLVESKNFKNWLIHSNFQGLNEEQKYLLQSFKYNLESIVIYNPNKSTNQQINMGFYNLRCAGMFQDAIECINIWRSLTERS